MYNVKNVVIAYIFIITTNFFINKKFPKKHLYEHKNIKNNFLVIEQKRIDIYKNNFYSGNIFIKKYISTLLRRIHSFNLFGEPF